MNDNDIMKALECLGGDEVLCRECVYGPMPYHVCKQMAAKNALDYINRQKAEIERLNHIRAELSKEIDDLKWKIEHHELEEELKWEREILTEETP